MQERYLEYFGKDIPNNNEMSSIANACLRKHIGQKGVLRGFTLIELLVVIAIISLLVSILLPSLKEAKKQASLVVCASNMRNISTALAMYSGEYNEKLPDSMGSAQPWNSEMQWASWLTADREGYRGMGLLVYAQFITEPAMLYCPSQTNVNATVKAYPSWPRPGYSYGGAYITWGGYDWLPWWCSVDGKAAGWNIPSLSMYVENTWPVINDFIASPLQGANVCHENKWNVVYGDGHVKPYTNGAHDDYDDAGAISDRDFLTLISQGSSTSWGAADLMRLRFIPNF